MKKPLRHALSTAFFLGFVAAVQSIYGWEHLLAPWQTLTWPSIGFAMALMLLSYALRTWRFYGYFSEIHGGFLTCLRLMLQHNLWNNLLPMRSGEVSFPILMKRYFAVPVPRSTSALAWFRAMDLHTLGSFAWVALCFMLEASLWVPIIFGVVLPLWMSLPWFLQRYLLQKKPQCLAVEEKPIKGLKPRLRYAMAVFIRHTPETSRAFFYAWGLTLVNWWVKLAVFSWVLLQFSDISVMASLAGVIGGEVTSVLPVNGVAGAGTYEGGVAALAALYGHDFKTLFLAAVNLHLFVLGAACLSGVLSLFLPKGMGTKNHG